MSEREPGQDPSDTEAPLGSVEEPRREGAEGLVRGIGAMGLAHEVGDTSGEADPTEGSGDTTVEPPRLKLAGGAFDAVVKKMKGGSTKPYMSPEQRAQLRASGLVRPGRFGAQARKLGARPTSPETSQEGNES